MVKFRARKTQLVTHFSLLIDLKCLVVSKYKKQQQETHNINNTCCGLHIYNCELLFVCTIHLWYEWSLSVKEDQSRSKLFHNYKNTASPSLGSKAIVVACCLLNDKYLKCKSTLILNGVLVILQKQK